MSVVTAATEAIAVITMDDGKVNVLGPAMLAEINRRSTGTEADDAAPWSSRATPQGVQRRFRPEGVRIRGSPGRARHAQGGFRVVPTGSCRSKPVVAAITGHAIAIVPRVQRRSSNCRSRLQVPCQ